MAVNLGHVLMLNKYLMNMNIILVKPKLYLDVFHANQSELRKEF